MNKRYFLEFIFLTIVKIFVYIAIVYLTYEVIFKYTPFNGQRLTSFGFKNEVLLVIVLGLTSFFFTRRFYLSIILTLLLYYLFVYISFEKIRFFNTPLLPSDYKYIDQLILIWPIFKSYIPIITLTLLMFSFTVYFFIKKEKANKFLKHIPFLVNISAFILILIILIRGTGLYTSLKFKLAENERGRAHLVSSSEKNGLLVTFVRNILHSKNDVPPEDYSALVMKNIYDNMETYPASQIVEGNDSKTNLIIYLIESFTDPYDAGIKTTLDPIPFFHQLQKEHESGFVYSPEIGGRSANVEFELLTGFTMQFFFKSTIPFIDLPQRPIPSIAREMGINQYYTKVIQAANLGFFNYKQMYKTLGFQDVISLSGKKNIPLDAAGRFPSDEAIVDEIIESSKGKENFFIYAFPNSTHGTWKYNAYDKSPIDLILDNPLNDELGEKQLRTYVNALNTADMAIKKLINHFEKINTKTVILILGDHQPGMPEFREQYMFKKFPNQFTYETRRKLKGQFLDFDKKNPLITHKIMHKVPYVIWTNFESQNTSKYNTGMNSLILKVFDKLNIIPKSPFYKFLREYSKKVSMESLLKFVFYDGEGLSSKNKQWNEEYRKIQYDLLIGDEFFLDN